MTRTMRGHSRNCTKGRRRRRRGRSHTTRTRDAGAWVAGRRDCDDDARLVSLGWVVVALRQTVGPRLGSATRNQVVHAPRRPFTCFFLTQLGRSLRRREAETLTAYNGRLQLDCSGDERAGNR